MAKINITFDDTNYQIDESSFAEATSELKQNLSTTMSGSGATVILGGISYDIDSAKLSSATNDFIAHLRKIAGNGYKVVVDGTEYSFDSTKVEDAISALKTVFGNLHNPDDVVDIVIILDEAILDEHVLG